eukprot:GEMP01082157.1.p1 GENE.GEMP01082157.1~~GEMP01082157.1.p1  ORF type:complete len:163 (+),score=35.91 GEMP01082157.1:70-489(+)
MAVRLRLRKLPFLTTAGQVREFFRGFQLAENCPAGTIDFLRTYDSKPTGHCFVYFDDEREAMRARDALHRSFWVRTSDQPVGRIDVLEDWSIGRRKIVEEEYTPGDIEDEDLKDKARELMIGNKHLERKHKDTMEKNMW